VQVQVELKYDRTADNTGFPADAQIRRFLSNGIALVSKGRRQPEDDLAATTRRTLGSPITLYAIGLRRARLWE